MKRQGSKYTTVLLAILVAGIWAGVVWIAVSPGHKAAPVSAVRGTVQDRSVKVEDTLRLDYPDPFLKRTQESRTEESGTAEAEEQRAEPVQHKFQYLGHIHNKARGTDTYILRIDGTRYSLTPGQYAGELRLVRATADELIFKDDNNNYKYNVSL